MWIYLALLAAFCHWHTRWQDRRDPSSNRPTAISPGNVIASRVTKRTARNREIFAATHSDRDDWRDR